MFRFFTLLVTFLALLSAASGAYQQVLHAEIGACADLTSCFAQVTQIVTQPSILTQDIVWLTHSLSTVALLFFLAGMLLSSFWVQTSKLVLMLWTLLLACLAALQVTLGMHSAWLATPAVHHLLHYLLSACIVFIGFYVYLRGKAGIILRTDVQPRWLVRSAITLLLVQIALGAWLAANHAGLVCDGFPRCLGEWWPQASYQYAFDLFSPLSFSAKVAVHWVHRLWAIVTFLVLAFVMLVATGSHIKPVRLAGYGLSLLLLLQVAAGIALVKLALPAWLVVVHSVTAIVLMLPLLAIHFYFRYQALDTAKDEPLVAETQSGLELDDELSLDISAFEHLDEESAVVEVDTPATSEPESLYLRLKSQLGKTRSGLGSALSSVSLGARKIDRHLLEEIETNLLMADVGMDATTDIINQLQESVEKHQLKDASALSALLKQQLLALLEPVSEPLVIPEKEGPFVILVVGVNGVGKTTTIGKLAQRLQRQGHSVMLAAGDTFRAAAVEQLQTWGERNQIHVVAQHTGADSASVIFDGLQSAKAKGIDVLIADTAGRLHTKSNLMEELKKVKRIMAKLDPTAPHEVLLVLDAGTGQNALSQAEHFNNTVALTGLALTKLDGTAKGGIIFALAKQRGIPIRFLGVGEGIDDLQDFHAAQFIDALFADNT